MQSKDSQDYPQIQYENYSQYLFGLPERTLCMTIADTGFPKYKLTQTEQEVALASSDIRRADTVVGTSIGLGIGALVGFLGLRKRRLPLKIFTTSLSTTLFSLSFFALSTNITMAEWATLDDPGHVADGEISFMAEFARRIILAEQESRFSNKQLHIFYRQQLRGQKMRFITEEEEKLERENEEKKANKTLKTNSSWWW